MTYETLLDALDMDSVVSSIRSVELKPCDYQDAATMVLKAIKRWGPADYLDYTIQATEELCALELPSQGGYIAHIGLSDESMASLGSRCIKGYMDLVGERSGKREVIDWKTTGSINAQQQDRLKLSWQWKLYGTIYNAQRVVYRSIQRDGRCVETRLDWPSAAYTDADLVDHYRKALDLRDSMKDRLQWLQHAPYACNAYGRDCPHLSLCAVHNQAPRKLIELKHLSYSSVETLLLCPERFRLDKIFKEAADGDSSDSTDLGSAFHAGVADAWRQIGALQKL